MAHTPGPWDCEMRRPAGVMWDAIIRSYEKRDPICTVFMAGYMAKEANANARLIAAAPDMLASLRDLISLNDHPPSQGEFYDAQVRIATARAAIAKATGNP